MTQGEKNINFVGNTGRYIWNGIISLAESATNFTIAIDAVGNTFSKGTGIKRLYNGTVAKTKGAAVGVYDWTFNTSWHSKAEDLNSLANDPHTYEQLFALALTDKVADISPIVHADGPIMLPEAEATAKGTLSKGEQLVINKAISKESEKLVESRLESQLGEGEILLVKPRIYLNNEAGNLTKNYAVPDFAIYNEKTGEIVDIVDAKNGEGGLTGAQKKLKERGGQFKGSKRYPDVKSQDINKNRVRIERTNITTTSGGG